MTLQELRDKANARLVPFWQMLIEKQPSYFLKHGVFFQLLITSRVVDGEDTDWEQKHPSDETRHADVDFPWMDKIPFQISVDTFGDNPSGFSATATVELPNGNVYRRTRKATAIVQEPVYDNVSADNPVLLSPKSIASFDEEDTGWYLFESEVRPT